MLIYKTSRYPSPIGYMVMVGTETALSALWFEKGDTFVWTKPAEAGESAIFSKTKQWLNAYFFGNVVDSTTMPPLAPEGTAFQRAVWQRLLCIPYGETTTYGAIAKDIAASTGRPMSARAVGGAVGKNPISILIPCHRVIGAGGKLTGYAGGIHRKFTLLAWECYHKNPGTDVSGSRMERGNEIHR